MRPVKTQGNKRSGQKITSEADHEATVAPSLTDSMSTDTFLSMLDDTVDESSTSLDDYPPVQDDCPVEIPLTTTETC